MKFADIHGLEIEKQKLLAFKKQGRLPHALLFSGPEGCGKLSLGLALIQFLQCQNPGEDDSCGRCSACQKTDRLIHPDVHISFPTSGAETLADEVLPIWRSTVLANPYLNASTWQVVTQKENKLLNINAKECRNLIKKLSFTLYESHLRILLVWLPEYLGKEGNILLKLIEEPPANSLILLITENKDLVLPTILSRCQSLAVPTFTDKEIAHQLRQNGLKDEFLLSIIVQSAEGNMLEAMQLQQELLNPPGDEMIKWLRLCYKSQPEELVSWAEQYAPKGREIHRQFLKFGLRFIQRILEYKIQPNSNEAIQPDELKAIKGLAHQLSVDEIHTISDLFDDHIYFIERNANPKILFTALSLNLRQVLNHETVRTLNII